VTGLDEGQGPFPKTAIPLPCRVKLIAPSQPR
jgi:hypothetical protein